MILCGSGTWAFNTNQHTRYERVCVCGMWTFPPVHEGMNASSLTLWQLTSDNWHPLLLLLFYLLPPLLDLMSSPEPYFPPREIRPDFLSLCRPVRTEVQGVGGITPEDILAFGSQGDAKGSFWFCQIISWRWILSGDIFGKRVRIIGFTNEYMGQLPGSSFLGRC